MPRIIVLREDDVLLKYAAPVTEKGHRSYLSPSQSRSPRKIITLHPQIPVKDVELGLHYDRSRRAASSQRAGIHSMTSI